MSELPWIDLHDYVVELHNGCWEWTGTGRYPDGTPKFHGTTARRTVWKNVTGLTPPDDLALITTCGYIQCVNPEHMQVGTRAEVAAVRDHGIG